MSRQKDWEPKWDEKAEVWAVDFRVEGHRIRKRLGLHSRSEKALARQIAKRIWIEAWEAASAARDAPLSPPFYQAAADYVEGGGEARFLEPIVRHLGPDFTVADATDEAIEKAASELYPGRARATWQRQVFVPMNAVRQYAAGKRRKPSGDNARVRWLTPEEAERLLKAAEKLVLPKCTTPEPYTVAKIASLLGTGWRTGECFAALAENYNQGSGEWWTPGDELGARKSAASARWVVIPSKASAYLGYLPDVGRAFLTPYGKPIVMRSNGGGQMAESFKRARTMAGLGPEVTPHVLRHTWATWAYAQTKDLLWVARRGGWSSVRMVERYAKLAPLDLPARLKAYGWDLSGGEYGQDLAKSASETAEPAANYLKLID